MGDMADLVNDDTPDTYYEDLERMRSSKYHDKIRLYGPQFRKLFKVQLGKYLHPLFGFDIVKFDEEVIQPPDGVSTKQHIFRMHGKEGTDLILNLIGGGK